MLVVASRWCRVDVYPASEQSSGPVKLPTEPLQALLLMRMQDGPRCEDPDTSLRLGLKH